METDAPRERPSLVRDPRVRSAAVAFLLLLLLGLVAVASGARGRGTIAPAPRGVPVAFFDYLYTLGIVVLAAGVLVVLLLRLPGAPVDRGRTLHEFLAATVGSVLLVVAFLYGFHRAVELGFFDALDLGEGPGARGGGDAELRPGARQAEFRAGLAMLVGTAAATAFAAHLLLRRRRRRAAFRVVGSVTEELADLLDDTLDDLRAERDARRAVIAAYARMERTLAAHGLPRRPAEAPLEYLARALRKLRVPAAAALELTALFERAKFSPHLIDAGMKEEAIAALAAVRDDLRAAA